MNQSEPVAILFTRRAFLQKAGAIAAGWTILPPLSHAQSQTAGLAPAKGETAGEDLIAAIEDHLKVGKASLNLKAYKARPLNGIWATAPYLHNGSVPNLWQLLQPPAARVREFYVGSRAFDPVQVGFAIESFPGGFQFDTSLRGNSNSGHDYGTALADAQKWELIEYLKSL